MESGEREEQTSTQFKDLLLGYWRPILRLGGVVVALNVVNYTLLSYMPTYLEQSIGLSSSVSLLVPIIGMLAMMVFLPLAGSTSDRVGRKPMWWFSLIGLFIAGVPMFMLMGTNAVGAVIGFAVLGLLYVPQLATISAMFPAMFPTHVRYAGFAIADNVSTSIFGGTAPAVNDWLVNSPHRRQTRARVLHDGCLCRRGDRPDQGARDHPLPDERHGVPGHCEGPAAARIPERAQPSVSTRSPGNPGRRVWRAGTPGSARHDGADGVGPRCLRLRRPDRCSPWAPG